MRNNQEAQTTVGNDSSDSKLNTPNLRRSRRKLLGLITLNVIIYATLLIPLPLQTDFTAVNTGLDLERTSKHVQCVIQITSSFF